MKKRLIAAEYIGTDYADVSEYQPGHHSRQSRTDPNGLVSCQLWTSGDEVLYVGPTRGGPPTHFNGSPAGDTWARVPNRNYAADLAQKQVGLYGFVGSPKMTDPISIERLRELLAPPDDAPRCPKWVDFGRGTAPRGGPVHTGPCEEDAPSPWEEIGPDLAREVIARREQAANPWRSVADDPPPVGVEVLGWWEPSVMFRVSREPSGATGWYDADDSKCHEPVWWMPVPPPPNAAE